VAVAWQERQQKLSYHGSLLSIGDLKNRHAMSDTETKNVKVLSLTAYEHPFAHDILTSFSDNLSWPSEPLPNHTPLEQG